MTTYTFDGLSLTIKPNNSSSFSAEDLYSRWKEWVQLSDNSKYPFAFRTAGGDPIGGGQSVAPYYFLNTTDGWRIRPYEANYELRIAGNLYSDDANLAMFVPTLGNHTVTIIIERSASAIEISVGGADQAAFQSALTAQGYTAVRAIKLDNLDTLVSSACLTTVQATMLLEIYRLFGLDPTRPLVVTPTTRKVVCVDGEIDQAITKVGSIVTVQRN